MYDLTWPFPVPRPLTIAGETLLVVCLQVRDLATLQSYHMARAGSPLAAARADLFSARDAAEGDYLAATAEGRRYAALCRATWTACEAWSPGPSGDAPGCFADGAGMAFFLTVLLSRCNPGFGDVDALRLLIRLAEPEHAHQWIDLLEVAYARHPLDSLSEMMDPGAKPSRPRVNWLEELPKLVAATGWDYETIGELYLSQLRVHNGGGQLKPASDVGPAVGARRAKLWGRTDLGPVD